MIIYINPKTNPNVKVKTCIDDVNVNKYSKIQDIYKLHEDIKKSRESTLLYIWKFGSFLDFDNFPHMFLITNIKQKHSGMNLACKFLDRHLLEEILRISYGEYKNIFKQGMETPLHSIARNKRNDLSYDSFRRYCKYFKCILNQNNMSPLELACINNDYSMVKTLLKIGSRVYSRILNYSCTPRLRALLLESYNNKNYNVEELKLYRNDLRWRNRNILILWRYFDGDIENDLMRFLSFLDDGVFRNIITFLPLIKEFI